MGRRDVGFVAVVGFAVGSMLVGCSAGGSGETAEVEATVAPSSTAPASTAPSTTTSEAAVPEEAELPQVTVVEPIYRFPIEPAEAASYVDDHHTYPAVDIFADCGTAVVAPTSGVVVHARTADRWDPASDDPALRGGLSVAILGDDGVRYYGSHFEVVSVVLDEEVEAGQSIGTVGRSGNARDTPCHLHFGISPTCPGQEWQVRRGVLWPQPYLDDWRAGGQRSPTDEVRDWDAANNPSACDEAMADPTASLAD